MKFIYFFLITFLLFSCQKEEIILPYDLQIVMGETCLEDYVGYTIEAKRIRLPSYASGKYRIVVNNNFELYYNDKLKGEYDGNIHFVQYIDTLNYHQDIIFQITHCDSFYFHGMVFGKMK